MNQPSRPDSSPQWQQNHRPGLSGQPGADLSPGSADSCGTGPQYSAQTPHQWSPPTVSAEPLRLPASPSPYQQVWRTTWLRWWQPLVAIVLATVLWVVVTAIAFMVVLVIELAMSGGSFIDLSDAATGVGQLVMTPGAFLGNNVSLAAFWPIAVLMQLLFFRLKPGWLVSVTGKVRQGWMAVCLTIVVPVWVVLNLVDLVIHKIPDLSWSNQSLLLIVGILITTPFQAAGEEFMFRGLVFRGVGSYFANPKVAFWVGAGVSSVFFAAMHGATDIWLNVSYLSFGLVACWLTWKTGSLIPSIVIHVVNNLLAGWTFPFTDTSRIFDLSFEAADWTIPIRVLALVATGLLIVRAAKRRDLETLTPAT